jgi:hypothetical protein
MREDWQRRPAQAKEQEMVKAWNGLVEGDVESNCVGEVIESYVIFEEELEMVLAIRLLAHVVQRPRPKAQGRRGPERQEKT